MSLRHVLRVFVTILWFVATIGSAAGSRIQRSGRTCPKMRRTLSSRFKSAASTCRSCTHRGRVLVRQYDPAMVVASGEVHDVFEWWSLIWLPLGVGLASVLVAIAAFVASARATHIAEETERSRAEDQMRALAREDARALGRWVAVVLSPGVSFHWSTRLAGGPELPDALNGWVARADAESMLMGSTVPGAQALFAITRIDIENRSSFLPDEHERDAQAEMQARRDLRMKTRIREWASDPQGRANELVKEILEANANIERCVLSA